MNDDLNKNIADTTSTFLRFRGLFSGLAAAFVVFALGILILIFGNRYGIPLDDILPLVIGIFIFGILAVILSIIFYHRNKKQSTLINDQAYGKQVFADGNDEQAIFTTPTATITVPAQQQASQVAEPTVDGTEPMDVADITDFANETVESWIAPVMATNVVQSISILGKQKISRQENALLLTPNYLICIQIPVTDEAQQGLGGRLLAAIPMDVTQKNAMTSGFDQKGVRRAVELAVTNNTVARLMTNYYSFAIPKREILEVSTKTFTGINIRTSTLGNFSWSVMNSDKTVQDAFAAQLMNGA